jgi:uncharacterized protein YeaC (DUF1315 family)
MLCPCCLKVITPEVFERVCARMRDIEDLPGLDYFDRHRLKALLELVRLYHSRQERDALKREIDRREDELEKASDRLEDGLTEVGL